MANNMDEFDQDGYDSEGHDSGPKKSVSEAWSSRPMVKLGVIMLVVGTGIAGALGAFSGQQKPETPSKVVAAPALNEPPGGKSSPYFLEQNKLANEQRAVTALEQGGSAIPTPSGQNIDISELTNKKDPMLEFRAETERLKQEINRERQVNAQKIESIQKTQRAEREDDTLAQAMQRQMRLLMESWEPRKMEHVKGNGYGKEPAPVQVALGPVETSLSTQGTVGGLAPQLAQVLVPAGTVNYGQILTEANSDVPGPVLVQIASGPLSGGRAIGQFTVSNDLLIIRFSNVVYKGKEYPIDAIALDPNTTLAGMATDVDQRYFDRLILPAAAAFIAGFGNAMGETPVKTTVTDGGVVVAEQAKKGTKEALYDSISVMGKTAGRFFDQRASMMKPLVRVAVGTPMGIFFLSSVHDLSDMPTNGAVLSGDPSVGGLMANAYQQRAARPAQGLSVIRPATATSAQQPAASSYIYPESRTDGAQKSGVYYEPDNAISSTQRQPVGVYRTR